MRSILWHQPEKYQQKEKEDSVRSAQTFRKYKIKGIKFPTSSPIQAKGDKNRISCILKIEYTASGIHESCGRNKPRQPQKPYATTSKERARTAMKRRRIMLLPSSHSTPWSGNQAMRAAPGDPRRDEISMRLIRCQSFPMFRRDGC